MEIPKHIGFIIIHLMALIILITTYIFMKEFLRGAYMLIFISTGFIWQNLVNLKKSKNIRLMDKIPYRNLLILLLCFVMIIGMYLLGYGKESFLFMVAFVAGIFGVICLILIFKLENSDI